jgi:tyrosyl-tRNA synthetase
MAIKDQLIPDYFEFFTDKPMAKIDQISRDLKNNKLHPLEIKKQLALSITSQFHGQSKAKAAQTHFQTTFQQKKPKYTQTINSAATIAATIAPLVGSSSEAKRLISQGAVDINQTTITNPNLKPQPGDKIKIGKKIFRKVIK